MEPADKTRILCRLDYLATNTISLDRLTTLLVSEGALISNETVEFLKLSSDYKRCAFLYENIIKKGPKTFNILLKCLEKSGNERIADRLTQELTTREAEDFKYILEEGLDSNSNVTWCWSGFMGEEMHHVRILSRDVSRGLVTAYHAGDFRVTSWMYPLGIIFNREGLRNLPQRLHYPGIWVYDKVYDYEVSGLRRAPTIDAGFKVISKQSTRKGMQEFESWLDTQGPLYNSDNYNAVTNNCLMFTKAACEFLHIAFPPELEHMQEFVQKNPKTVRLFTFRSTSAGGSKVENSDSKANANEELKTTTSKLI